MRLLEFRIYGDLSNKSYFEKTCLLEELCRDDLYLFIAYYRNMCVSGDGVLSIGYITPSPDWLVKSDKKCSCDSAEGFLTYTIDELRSAIQYARLSPSFGISDIERSGFVECSICDRVLSGYDIEYHSMVPFSGLVSLRDLQDSWSVAPVCARCNIRWHAYCRDVLNRNVDDSCVERAVVAGSVNDIIDIARRRILKKG